MIIREFRCGDCSNTFESSDPVEVVVCPVCTAQEAERIFLTAPSIRDAKTSGTDATLRTLAADYGLSNMTNAGGAAVKQAPTGEQAPQWNAPTMQALSKLGKNGDGFSAVGSMLRGRGPNASLGGNFPFANREKLFSNK